MASSVFLGLTADGIAQSAFALATVSVLIATLRQNRQHNQNQTIAEFNRRYDRLWEYIHDKSSTAEFSTDKLIHRYWSLQLDQYQAWCRDSITDEQFIYWLNARIFDFHSKTPIGGVEFLNTMEIAQRTIKARNFWILMDQVARTNPGESLSLPKRSRKKLG